LHVPFFGTLGKTTTTRTNIFFSFLVEIILQVSRCLEHEIIDLLEIDDSVQASAIVIQPPENATAPVSDEDSGDEGGTINNLPGSLLRAPAYRIQDGYETYFQMKHISALINP
jgi:hypothetical protein